MTEILQSPLGVYWWLLSICITFLILLNKNSISTTICKLNFSFFDYDRGVGLLYVLISISLLILGINLIFIFKVLFISILKMKTDKNLESRKGDIDEKRY